MSSKNKIITAISLILVLLILISIGVFTLMSGKNIDKIEMEKSEALINKYPKIINQFTHFQRNGVIELYEYTDNVSYTDTLIFYFFNYNNAKEEWEFAIDKINSYLNDTQINEDNLADLINIIYLCSLVIDKYNLESDILSQSIFLRMQEFLKDYKNQDLLYINNYRKLYSAFKNVGALNEWNLKYSYYNSVESNDILTTLSVRSIECSLYNSDTTAILKDIIDNFNSKNIDIESLMIYLEILPSQTIKTLDESYIDKIYNYCKENYYYIPSYISFCGFRICENYNEDYIVKITDIYKNKPISTEGVIPGVAQIVPTYRRIFQYSETCNLLGINLDKAIVYELAEYIEPEKMMIEDFYYQSLLARNYPDISVDKKLLKDKIANTENVSINISNYYLFYYLIKAGYLNRIDSQNLAEKAIQFYNSNSDKYLLLDLLNSEICWLTKKSEFNPYEYLSRILESKDPVDIETYFHYAIILKNAGEPYPNELKESTLSKIQLLYTDSDHGGGFYANNEFRYIDITKTYECLFLENFIQTNQ